METQCSKCKQTKTLETDFTRDRKVPRGFRHACRECCKADAKAKRDRPDHRIGQREREARYRRRNRDRIRERAARERSTSGRKDDPYKVRARQALKDAVKAGRIVRPSTCSQCGWQGRIEAHHADYSKPFDVSWLCRICHARIHRKRP